jgi:hypothetical protein
MNLLVGFSISRRYECPLPRSIDISATLRAKWMG